MVERCCPSSPRTRPRLAECSWMAGCHAAAAGVASSFRQFNPPTSTSLGRGRDRATPSTQPRRRCSSRLPLSSTPHAARRCPVDSTRRTRLLLLLSVRAARAASAPARCPWPCPPYGTCTQAQCAHPPRLRPRRHPLPRHRLSRVCSQGEACFSTQVFSMTPEDAAHGSRTAGSPRSLRMTSSSRTAAAQALWRATRPWWQPLHASSLRHARYSHRLSRCTRHCHRHRTRHPVPNDVSSGGREQTASSRRNDGEAIAERWPAMQRLQADAGSSCRYAKSVGIAPEWKSRPSVACHRPGPRRRAAGGAGASLLGVEATECRCPASLVPRVLRLEGVRTDR